MKFLILPSAKYQIGLVKLLYYPLCLVFYICWFPIWGIIWLFTPGSRFDYGIYYNTPRNAFKEAQNK